MYKVFFKDRIIFFEDNFRSSFKINNGLFYKYGKKKELKELIAIFLELEKIRHLYLFHEDINKLKKKFTACFNLIKASGGLVKRDNSDFLIIKRNDIWDLPKGKNEPGEQAKKSALREVSEECGLKELTIGKEIVKTYHTYMLNGSPVLKETIWFEMISTDTATPVPQTAEGISMIKWVKPGETEFMLKNTYPSIIEVLKAGNVL